MTTTATSVSTWPPYVRDLVFGDLRAATLREAARLRERGAEVVLLVAHVGIKCDDDHKTHCAGELVDLLHALPPATVDAVVSGHSHSIVEARIDDVPVVQAGWKGEYLNVIDLPFDREARRVLRDDIRIEGPIAVRIPAKLHGTEVNASAAVDRVLRPVFARVAPIRTKVLASAAGPIERKERDGGMGDIVTDALRERAGTDFAIINGGGIRAGLPAGKITYGDAFEALPFENKVAVLRVSGRELKEILRVGESGAADFFPVSGLRLTINTCQRCPSDDLDGDGRIARWETNRLLDVARSDGSPIADDGQYTFATTDFVLQGGDYMAWPIARIPPDRIGFTPLLARDALVWFLQKRKRLATAVDEDGASAHARMLFVRRDLPNAAGGQ